MTGYSRRPPPRCGPGRGSLPGLPVVQPGPRGGGSVKFAVQPSDESTWVGGEAAASGKGTVLSLQSRLFLFFTIIVVVPLGVAGFLAQRAVSNLLQERDRSRVTLATPGVLAVYGGRIGTMPDR